MEIFSESVCLFTIMEQFILIAMIRPRHVQVSHLSCKFVASSGFRSHFFGGPRNELQFLKQNRLTTKRIWTLRASFADVLAKPTIFFGTDLGRCNSKQKTCEQVLAVKGLIFFSSVAKETQLSVNYGPKWQLESNLLITTKQNKTNKKNRKKRKNKNKQIN